MPNENNKFIESLPVLAFLGYWLYSCLICAALSGDVRLLKIWFVSSPVLIASALSLIRIYKGQAAS
ncbi:MAG TPA: hypothetical protein DCS63_01330 [Elusimicrobia bacterium]|nr:hypothetical protein [Elusimicrobiota bacterium]